MAINLNDIEIFSDLLGNNFGKNAGSSGGTTNAGTGGNLLNILGDIINQVPPTPSGPQLGPDDFGSYVIPASDPTFSTGQQYARSIASGGNIPGMISSGTSYSAANPEGFTQADINSGVVPNPFAPPAPQGTPSPYGVFADDPSYFGTGIGGVNIPTDRHNQTPRELFGGFQKPDMKPEVQPITPPVTETPPAMDIFNDAGNTSSLTDLINIGKLFDGTFDFSNILNGLNSDIPNVPVDTPPPVIPGAVSGPVDMPIPPIQQDQIFIDDRPNFIEEDFFTPPVTIPEPISIPEPAIIQGPVDMPIPPKQKEQLFIDDIPRFNDIPSIEYVVPEVPLNNLLNQSPPQGPVGMSPQETAKMSSQQELSNLISNKDILQEIPADDGVRNQYQVELDEFINKSPINMETYKEELPVGSAINLGIPAVMETVAPMAVPGLGLATNILNSFQNDFAPSPKPSPAPSISSFTPGIDYSSVRRFGR